jgi:hypothetical protein
MDTIKIASIFFIGNLLLGSLSIFIALLFKDVKDPIIVSIVISVIIVISTAIYLKKKKFFSINTHFKEIFFILLLFIFGMYIMQKSLSYSNGVFEIASNQYLDFGGHIPTIRSFSLGENIPPMFPYYAGTPNTYHFMFYYLISLYEKMGLPIDYSFNILSALAFSLVCVLIYKIAYILFKKNKIVGVLSVVFFIFNSSLSFIDLIKRYGLNLNIISNIYNHNIYIGNGPFGNNIVSIFWNVNTYLNQRHFLFGLGVGLLIMYLLFFLKKFSKKILFALGIIIGILPLWHMTVFLSLIITLLMRALLNTSNRKSYIFIFILSIIIASPQLIYISMFSDNNIVFRPGFLVSENLTLLSFANYWFFNLGFSIFTILLGVIFANKKQKLFILSLLPLFVVPNLFQFGGQMFDNHKFFNIFIIFANMFSAYAIYLLLRKKNFFRVFGLLLIALVTLSGIIDFFVVKNDVKTKIADYPSSSFQLFVLKNTSKHAVFLSNKLVYDPITLVGRQSYLGEPHYLFLFGKNPDEHIKNKSLLFSSNNKEEIKKVLRQENISYIAIYKKEKMPRNYMFYKDNFKEIYEDDTILLVSTTILTDNK